MVLYGIALTCCIGVTGIDKQVYSKGHPNTFGPIVCIYTDYIILIYMQ